MSKHMATSTVNLPIDDIGEQKKCVSLHIFSMHTHIHTETHIYRDAPTYEYNYFLLIEKLIIHSMKEKCISYALVYKYTGTISTSLPIEIAFYSGSTNCMLVDP